MNVNKTRQVFQRFINVRSIKEIFQILREEKITRPFVHKPNEKGKIRIGRGWSKKEMRLAGISPRRIKKFNIQYDCRRKTCYQTNVDKLIEILNITEERN